MVSQVLWLCCAACVQAVAAGQWHGDWACWGQACRAHRSSSHRHVWWEGWPWFSALPGRLGSHSLRRVVWALMNQHDRPLHFCKALLSSAGREGRAELPLKTGWGCGGWIAQPSRINNCLLQTSLSTWCQAFDFCVFHLLGRQGLWGRSQKRWGKGGRSDGSKQETSGTGGVRVEQRSEESWEEGVERTAR